MKSTSLLLATLFITTLLVSGNTLAAEKDDTVIATVNGKNITEWTLKRYASQRGLPPGPLTNKQREMLIEELINRELIYQDAVSIGIDKAPAIKKEIAHQRVNIIASTMLNRSSDRFEVSEEAMKKEYEKRKDELGGKEYKARHILLKNENDAKAVIAELDKGADFATLAGKESTGPSAVNGGDLGWFSPGQMDKTFAEATAKLKKGQYTKTPVHTDFGWHVIKLEDTRMVSPPKFEDIKEQIRVGLQNKLIEDYIRGLRESAKIQRK
ncbi:MAG TPA: peptidylprolyl isomerase [Gammaproteobacteria bacterium]|nr:peptidylprolyl isomerase [Gammaproteobacteria bacterium]